MKERLLLLLASIMIPMGAIGQVYDRSFGREAGILSPGILSMGASLVIQKKHPTLTPADIERLDASSIAGIDRWVTQNWDPRAHQISNGLLYSAYALPLTFLADQQGRDEIGNLGLFTLEALLLNNGIGNLTKHLTKRVRPFVYGSQAPDSKKFRPNANLSFFSGHTSNVACMYFLSAKAYSDIYPQSDARNVIWSLAAIVPAVQGYLRVRAGKHFVTDVIVGYLVGAAVGIAVPALHK